jgi:hypothetical protein
MPEIEIITDGGRRRHWSAADKLRIVRKRLITVWNCLAAAPVRLSALGTPDSFGRSIAAGVWNYVATGQSSNVHQTDLGTFTSVSARKQRTSRCLG